jgi:hypothetical protein
MPPEFCEFNPEKQFLKCIPWLIAQGYQRLYPHLDLQQKLQQVKSKSKKPTATFYAWPEISLFHNVRHRLADKPQALLTYRAKIKREYPLCIALGGPSIVYYRSPPLTHYTSDH